MREYMGLTSNVFLSPIVDDSGRIIRVEANAELVLLTHEVQYEMEPVEDGGAVLVKYSDVQQNRMIASTENMRKLADALYEISDRIDGKVEEAISIVPKPDQNVV